MSGKVVEPLVVVGTETFEFSVLTQEIVCAEAEASSTRIMSICPSTALVVVIVIVKVAAELFVTVEILRVIGTVAAFPEAVIALLVLMMFPGIVTRAVEVPMEMVVASPAKLTVVAVLLTNEKVEEGVVIEVETSGEVMAGVVRVFAVSVCVPPTVTTLAILVPAVVTRKSPVETVKMPDEWVRTVFPLEKLRTAPEARNRSAQETVEDPNADPSFVAGVREPVTMRALLVLRVFAALRNRSVSVGFVPSPQPIKPSVRNVNLT